MFQGGRRIVQKDAEVGSEFGRCKDSLKVTAAFSHA